jgi:hypothetical protein
MFLPNGVYRFEKLHMLSTLVRTIDVSVDAVEWLNSKFGAPSLNTQTPRRIYLSRSDAKNRYVSNEPQLANVLSDFGFTTLAMSNLSLGTIRSKSSARQTALSARMALPLPILYLRSPELLLLSSIRLT